MISFIKEKDQVFNIDCSKYELFDKNNFEKLDLKFSKTNLGVHKKSNNTATRGELGRYPTLIYIQNQVLRNWFRITSYNLKKSILYDTYLCNLQLTANNKSCWWSNLKHFLAIGKTLGLSSMIENHGCKGNAKNKTKTAINSMKYIFEFQWRNEIKRTTTRNKGGGNKLRTYSTFKKIFEYEKYLDLQPKFDLRRNITKLRISSHKLEIEVGRYTSKTKREKLILIRDFAKNVPWVRWRMKNMLSIQFNSIQFLIRQSCTIEYNIIYIYTFTIDKPSCKLD